MESEQRTGLLFGTVATVMTMMMEPGLQLDKAALVRVLIFIGYNKCFFFHSLIEIRSVRFVVNLISPCNESVQ